MGLDLVLYTADKSTEEGIELAYGRKTWAIEEFFEKRCEMTSPDSYVFLITEEAWNEFIEVLTPYMESKLFRALVEEYDEFGEANSYAVENIIEHFLDDTLESDGHYQLGPAWEAHAVLEWYDADKEVRACFDKGKSVWMLASF